MAGKEAKGLSASLARIQMKETDINRMKVWQFDVSSWQRAYANIFWKDDRAK